MADHARFYNRLQVRHLNFQRRKSAKRTQFCVRAIDALRCAETLSAHSQCIRRKA